MLYSMTGFGRAEQITPILRVVVEIKSVNSKSFDLRTRLSSSFQSKEIELRKIVQEQLIRGKVDLNLTVERVEESDHKINTNAFNSYYKTLTVLADNQGIDSGDLLYTITRMPGVIIQNSEAISKEDWQTVQKTVEEALTKIIAYRTQEGIATEKDIVQNITALQELLYQVDPAEQGRIDKIRQRLLSALEKIQLNNQVDENRLEQEMIFYLDKFDLNEEKVRLEQHFNYFLEELQKETPSKGKKLGFILQEIGREINTLGSKANSATIQRIVIQMKNYADKIKEQLANIM